MKIKSYFLIIFLVLIGGFLRFYKLSDYPIQLNADEVSQAFDLASIVKTGKDIYGNFLPLAFPSTGDVKVGHYIYISTIPYLIFGDKEFTIRIASAFFGTLTIVSVFLFIYALTKNFWLAYSAAGLITFTPSEIFYARKSFENVIGISLIFFGLYFLFADLEKFKNNLKKYMGLFFLAAAMYVYTAHTIVVPLLILLYLVIFKNFRYPLVFWAVLILPLIFITVTSSGLRFRANSIFISQDANLSRQIDFSQNIFKTYIDYVFNRYLNQFNLSYIFGNGLDLTNQGLIGMGPLFFWQLPLFFLGVIFIIKTNSLSNEKKFFLFGLAMLPMIPSALTIEPFSPHRSVLEFSVLSIFSGFGLYYLVKSARILAIVLILPLSINFIYLINMYTVNYPYEKSQQISYPFKELALFAWSQYDNFEKIIIDPTYGDATLGSAPTFGVATHYYLAYYGKYNPAKFQKDLKIDEIGMTFDKFSVKKLDWYKAQNFKNTLIIASPWSLPIDSVDKSKIIKRFNFYNRQPAFYAIKL